MSSKKPILVTGCHRSGSTWVGKVLATSPSVRYIPEPFNINHPQCSCGCKFNLWYQYISQENEAIFYEHLKHKFGLSYDFRGEFKMSNNPKSVLDVLTKSSKLIVRNLLGIRPLVKDPIAFFSAQWLAATFDMDVVVLIRHPAAFASSLKRLNWTFPYSHFLEQPLLMKDCLQPFADEIKRYSEQSYDIIDQASLLWRIIHYWIDEYQKEHQNWIFIRHEDISRNPLSGFQELFNQLNLDYTEATKQTILDYSSINNKKQDYEADELKRHSKKNIEIWKTRLTPAEIERVRTKVEDISSKFYCQKDW